jgi:low affinity Fe/Cu permease
MPAHNSHGASASSTSHHHPDIFTRFATWTSQITGGRWAFLTAIGVIVVWAVSGPYFGFSETWQLVVNTGTTIVTFLMVFLIQNAQNRESKALHLKLDEVIRALRHADNQMIDIEEMTEDQLDDLHARYMKLAGTTAPRIERRVEAVNRRVDRVEDEVEEVDRRVDAIDLRTSDDSPKHR